MGATGPGPLEGKHSVAMLASLSSPFGVGAVYVSRHILPRPQLHADISDDGETVVLF